MLPGSLWAHEAGVEGHEGAPRWDGAAVAMTQPAGFQDEGPRPSPVPGLWVIKPLSSDERPEGRLLGIQGPWMSRGPWGGRRGRPGPTAEGVGGGGRLLLPGLVLVHFMLEKRRLCYKICYILGLPGRQRARC